MAELRSVAIGHDFSRKPGSVMHGVTGREGVLEVHLSRTVDFIDTHSSSPPNTTNPTSPTKFDLPVDSEHKSLRLKPFSLRLPHMRAFHLSWLTHFVVFFSTFAAAPLLPIIREDLNLTGVELSTAGIATVTGTIVARVVMGTVCDTVGPRYGIGIVVMGTAPAVFIISRLCIGFALAEFVAIQFWCSSMFSPSIVGLANATAAGWGNLGGGFTQFLMPLVFGVIASVTEREFLAWRVAFFVPGVAMVGVGIMVQESGKGVFLAGARNYRTWILVALYGFSFGTELTMNNITASYFFDRFDVDLRASGFIASSFGLMNVFSRSTGGRRRGEEVGDEGEVVDDTMAGVMCVVTGRMSNLGAAIATLLIYAIFTQASTAQHDNITKIEHPKKTTAAEGACFGVVPFVSRRALGVVSGFVGAGGNAGSALVQGVFFQNSEKIKTEDGITYLGFSMVGVSLLCTLIHFPQWGSIDFTKEERAQNRHAYVLQFAENSRSERGSAYMRRIHKESPAVPNNNNISNGIVTVGEG
eukprot:jgi/Chlat1/8626/Chrsp86S08027